MKKILLVALSLFLAACASGKGRIETMFDGINPVDALTVVGLGRLAYEASGRSVWDAVTTPIGGNRFRVTMKRNRLVESGDGEARVVLRHEAEKIAAAESCASWRVVEYEERYEAMLLGAQRVAEGVIECVRG